MIQSPPDPTTQQTPYYASDSQPSDWDAFKLTEYAMRCQLDRIGIPETSKIAPIMRYTTMNGPQISIKICKRLRSCI